MFIPDFRVGPNCFGVVHDAQKGKFITGKLFFDQLKFGDVQNLQFQKKSRQDASSLFKFR